MGFFQVVERDLFKEGYKNRVALSYLQTFLVLTDYIDTVLVGRLVEKQIDMSRGYF